MYGPPKDAPKATCEKCGTVYVDWEDYSGPAHSTGNCRDAAVKALADARREVERLRAEDYTEIGALLTLLESQLTMWRASGRDEAEKRGACEALVDIVELVRRRRAALAPSAEWLPADTCEECGGVALHERGCMSRDKKLRPARPAANETAIPSVDEKSLTPDQRIARFVNGARETLASYLKVAVERGYKGAVYFWCEKGDDYQFSIRIQAEPPRFPIENLLGNVEKYDLTGDATRAGDAKAR